MSSLVTKKAPEFSATAVMEDGSFKQVSLSDYQGQYVLLYFYPLDFTFVCPSEILAFNSKVADSNCPGSALSIELLEVLPRLQAIFLWGVDQIEVYVVKLHVLERGFKG